MLTRNSCLNWSGEKSKHQWCWTLLPHWHYVKYSLLVTGKIAATNQTANISVWTSDQCSTGTVLQPIKLAEHNRWILWKRMRSLDCLELTHWGRDKMAAISQVRIFKCIFLNENFRVSNKISLKYVPWGLINNVTALVQIMAWRRIGEKPLSEAMLVCFTDAYVRHSVSMS